MIVTNTMVPVRLRICNIIEILLIYTVTAAAQCPDKCVCTSNQENHYAINCINRTSEHSQSLSAEINQLLSTSQFYMLVHLSIENTPLTDVPRSVCNLTDLAELRLDRNRLTQLPTDCFCRMPKLGCLSATNNNISRITSEVFEGVDSLRTLSLQNNRIATLDSKIFRGNRLITSVNLTNNFLSALDVWPLVISADSTSRERVIVMVDQNNISSFTNELGWRLNLSSVQLHSRLSLTFNAIHHVADMLHGWNLTIEDFAKMLGMALSDENGHAMLELSIHGNTWDCDCVDYDLYLLDRNKGSNRIYGDEMCSSPRSMVGEIIRTVPLSKLFCKITHRCPTTCTCLHYRHNNILVVDCSGKNLSSIPERLPPLPDNYTKYYVNISHNMKLRNLSFQSYMANMSVLDASYCRISSVSEAVWPVLFKAEKVRLNDNRLKKVTDAILAFDVFNSTKLFLGHNPWVCYCSDNWMTGWLSKYRANVIDYLSVYCMAPHRLYRKSMIQVPAEDFCSDPNERFAIKFSVAAVAIFGALGIVICLAYRLRLKMFIRWKFHPFDRDECTNEDMEYDVFLSCSSEDYNPDIINILDLLESKGYKVCYHERDFQAGRMISDNICHAIERSKRTVCLITTNFINSTYCMWEFDMAHYHNVINLRKRRLIVLMKLPTVKALCRRPSPQSTTASECSSLVTDSLRQFLHQYTYIDYTVSDWIDKLAYALPIKGMGSNENRSNPTENTSLLNNM